MFYVIRVFNRASANGRYLRYDTDSDSYRLTNNLVQAFRFGTRSEINNFIQDIRDKFQDKSLVMNIGLNNLIFEIVELYEFRPLDSSKPV